MVGKYKCANMCFPLAKQCYNCQGLGHVQADCPTLRLNGGSNGRCYNCSQVGHLAVSRVPGIELVTGSDGMSDIYCSVFFSATALLLLLVLVPVPVLALLVVELVVLVVVSPVVSALDMVPTLVLPLATSAVVPTTSLVTARLRL